MSRRWFYGASLSLVLLALIGGLVISRVTAAPMLQDASSLTGKNIYFTEAGGEASRFDRSDAGLSRFGGLLSQLGASLYTLEWRTRFPTDADLIVIAGPNTDLSADQVARLWAYINNGGKLLLLANPAVENRNALPPGTGLFALMYADMGIRGANDVVVTSHETLAGTPELQANFIATNLNADHPITTGLTQGLGFFVARSLQVDSAIQGFTVTTLASSDETFYGETTFADYLETGVSQFDIGTDRTQGAIPLAAAYDNPRIGSRVVVVGDRDFAINGKGLMTAPANSAGFLYPDNARFLVNAVSWLLDSETPSLEFPTPGPTATATITPSPIPPTSEATPTATPTPAS